MAEIKIKNLKVYVFKCNIDADIHIISATVPVAGVHERAIEIFALTSNRR